MPGKSRIKSIAFSFALVLLIVSSLLLSTLSITVPMGLDRWLKQYDIQFSIEKARINPVTGRIALQTVKIGDVAATNPATVGKFELDIAVLGLFQRAFIVESLNIENTFLVIEQHSDDLIVAGINLSRLSDNDDVQQQEKSADNRTESTETTPWRWRINDIEFRGLAVDYLQPTTSATSNTDSAPTMAEKPIHLTVKYFKMDSIDSYAKNNITHTELCADINSVELQLTGNVKPLAQPSNGDMSVAIKHIDLVEMQHIATTLASDAIPANIAALDGSADINADIHWLHGDEVQKLALNTATLVTNAATVALLDKSSEQQHTVQANLEASIGNVTVDFMANHIQAENLVINGSTLNYANLLHLPKTDIVLTDMHITVDSINTASFDHVSNFSLLSKIGEFGKINLNGRSTIADFKANSSIQIEGEQLNLTSLSGFAAQAMNKTIEKGALDFSYNAALQNHRITSEADIDIHQLALDKADNGQDESIRFENELGMPINTALNLLRDKDDTIRLNVPINGPADDPQVNVNSIINKALLKTLKTAVLTQVGPLMALSALDKVKSLADAAKLKPVYFEPGSAKPNTVAQQDLDKLAEFLAKKDRIYVNICALAGASEIQSPSKEKLLELANQRATTVKQYLIDNDIDGKRLILCAPEIDTAENALPRVEFSL